MLKLSKNVLAVKPNHPSDSLGGFVVGGLQRLACLLPCLLLLAACATKIVVQPPDNPSVYAAQTLSAIQQQGQAGDWLVVRGYLPTDNLVSALTNAPFSHVAILDPEREQVIEAIGKGLQAVPLVEFIPKVQRLMLVRPQWATTPERQQAAVARARQLVGRPYDFLGLIGLNVAEAYYCSELAIAIYQPYIDRQQQRIPPIIPPVSMPYWGRVIWDSGPL